MESSGRLDILEEIRDWLSGQPPKERPKAIGRADVVAAQEEARFRRQRNTWHEVSCSGEKNLPELDPVSDHDGVVVPILVQMAANYVRAVALAFCDDVLVAGVPNAMEIVEIVQAFPQFVARDLHERHELGTSLLCWDAVVTESQYPSWAKEAAVQGPIDVELFVSLVCTFGPTPNDAISEQIIRRIDQFWEDHAKVLSEFTSGDRGRNLEASAPDRFEPPPRASRFPKRAVWLRERLHERGWNKHDLERFNGPSHKTTQKVLDGYAVRAGVLEAIADALSKKGAKVTVAEVPAA